MITALHMYSALFPASRAWHAHIRDQSRQQRVFSNVGACAIRENRYVSELILLVVLVSSLPIAFTANISISINCIIIGEPDNFCSYLLNFQEYSSKAMGKKVRKKCNVNKKIKPTSTSKISTINI